MTAATEDTWGIILKTTDLDDVERVDAAHLLDRLEASLGYSVLDIELTARLRRESIAALNGEPTTFYGNDADFIAALRERSG